MVTQASSELSNRLNQLLLDDLSDRFSALKGQESTYSSDDYIARIAKESCDDSKKLVDAKCRQTMAAWAYKILGFCKASPDTCSAVMSNLDRFLSTERGIFALKDRRWFQLAVMCSLHLAIKIHDSERLEMSAILQLGRGSFTADEVVLMEEEILYALDWRVCPPTPYAYLEVLIELVPETPTKQILFNNARKQIHKSVPHYRFSTASQSLLAIAAMLNAIDDLRVFPVEVEGAFIGNVALVTGLSCSDVNILKLKMDLRKLTSSNTSLKKKMSTANQPNNIANEPDSPVSVRQII